MAIDLRTRIEYAYHEAVAYAVCDYLDVYGDEMQNYHRPRGGFVYSPRQQYELDKQVSERLARQFRARGRV